MNFTENCQPLVTGTCWLLLTVMLYIVTEGYFTPEPAPYGIASGDTRRRFHPYGTVLRRV